MGKLKTKSKAKEKDIKTNSVDKIKNEITVDETVEEKYFNYFALKDIELRPMTKQERDIFVSNLKESLKLKEPVDNKLGEPKIISRDDLAVIKEFGGVGADIDRVDTCLQQVYPNIKAKIYEVFDLDNTLVDVTDVNDIYDEIYYLLCLGYDVSSILLTYDENQVRFVSKYAELRIKLNLLKGFLIGYDLTPFSDRLVCVEVAFKVLCEGLDASEFLHPSVQEWLNDLKILNKIEEGMVNGCRSSGGDDIVAEVLADVVRHVPYSSLYKDKYFERLTTPYARCSEDERYAFCLSLYKEFKSENIFAYKGFIPEDIMKKCSTISRGWKSYLVESNYNYLKATSNYFKIPLSVLGDEPEENLYRFACSNKIIDSSLKYINKENCLSYMLLSYNDVDIKDLIRKLESKLYIKSKAKFSFFKSKSIEKGVSVMEGRKIINSIVEGLTYGYDITAVRLSNCGYRDNLKLILDFCKYCWRFGLYDIQISENVTPKDIQ